MNVLNLQNKTTPVTQPARYYTPKEVAEILRVPVSWVYERTRFDQMPVRRFGRLVRIPVDEFHAWEKEQAGLYRQA
jgi:excisionase family DNA binding protein